MTREKDKWPGRVLSHGTYFQYGRPRGYVLVVEADDRSTTGRQVVTVLSDAEAEKLRNELTMHLARDRRRNDN